MSVHCGESASQTLINFGQTVAWGGVAGAIVAWPRGAAGAGAVIGAMLAFLVGLYLLPLLTMVRPRTHAVAAAVVVPAVSWACWLAPVSVMAVLACGMAYALSLFGAAMRDALREDPPSLCRSCGYDLAGLAAQVVCPECGEGRG